ncbi:leucyl/phenylalanyl-tRNA--protein transferase [Dissulfurirhabdus thermomarina]|uniref:Leucyl/phenylalanyl-tRNA--protein transferase n=1 Tax=Dissulfurirhabdus thermomarina TaxID=1765737 RepID=A0A6N9TQ38_DISTH|nr:leucyl/phenylalanyl-tRNA--protein transferase [Dissulfurirhabdus thermomarina]NDY42560.1 leucyl/phenylalanyl-tRNA--protein transferase [Dissulfurirhabdus thermomarina]NMX23169.1 leucyl/phenylalanyl-tRNA--protein transferase [Dissulfurirhabdus thermomarina]
MTVYLLDELNVFPSPDWARDDGLLAVGGDLSLPRLVAAYRQGIFPWYNPGEPILWWSPDPRLVLFPGKLHVSRRLKRILRRREFDVTFDHTFGQVIGMCAEVRRSRGEGTWLTEEMISAYTALHRRGIAHSVEVWREGRLAGGLYGVALGRIFFGESMFSLVSNASKVAFTALARQLEQWRFFLLDCQVATPHLRQFGTEEIPRALFCAYLREGVDAASLAPAGGWHRVKVETDRLVKAGGRPDPGRCAA